MRRFWRRHSDADLERVLRRNRPQAPPELVSAVAEDLAARSRPPRTSARLAFAGGLTAVLLAALAGTGGLTYAASGIKHGFTEATSLGGAEQTSASQSPSEDQYTKPGKGCGDNNRPHERRAECKAKVNDAKQKEGNSGTTPFVFTVSLDDTPIDTVTIGFTTADGTATAGQDYIPTSGTLTFAPGVTTQTVTVLVIGDTVREASETFYLNLTSISANGVIVDSQGVGTIANDDR